MQIILFVLIQILSLASRSQRGYLSSMERDTVLSMPMRSSGGRASVYASPNMFFSLEYTLAYQVTLFAYIYM